MKISYNWLKQYCKIDKSPDELAGILTSIGLEVEGTEIFESIRGGMEGLIIGKVISCSQHPDADQLSVTKVDIGADQQLSIVCGAPNVAEGQKVVVAIAGTTLYVGDKTLKIKKSKIRGELSEGMICAEDEIGLGGSHEGIIVLDTDAKIGKPAKEYFNIESDTVFEIGLTPNRIDAASHFGVARDVAAFLGQKQKISLQRPHVDGFMVHNHDYIIDVEIINKDACIRYSGLTITGVEVKESPQWLKKRLLSVGQKPINNIVDVTNYVLQETGQPLHAFDADEISGRKVIIKTLEKDTRFITLDETERVLSDTDLMICNKEEGMCIAGVFGGIKSGVKTTTANIFLESACFNPRYIRNTSKRHQLYTDSSFHFERGSDPDITIYALKRAALLILETAGGKVSSGIVDVYPVPVKPPEIMLSYSNVDSLIGITIDRESIKNILRSLDFTLTSENNTSLHIRVPNYRVDVHREADVIEEILRIYGYNYIYPDKNIKIPAIHSDKPDKHKLKGTISDMLAAGGFAEIMSNSLTSTAFYYDIKYFKQENTVKLHNPLSSNLDGLRQTMLYGGLEAIIYNVNRKVSDLQLFEFGTCYHFHAGKDTKNPLQQYSEAEHLAVFITGNKSEASWNSKPKVTDFYYLKSYVEKIMLRTGIDPALANTTDILNDIFRYGLAYSFNNITLAEFGAIRKNIPEKFGLDNTVFYADLRWDNIYNLAMNNNISYSEIPRFPGVKRDLALLIDKKTRFDEIKKLALKTEKKLLKKVNIFDIYEGEKLGENKKSYAISFYLQDNEKTLTDQMIETIMQNLIRTFEKELGAAIR